MSLLLISAMALPVLADAADKEDASSHCNGRVRSEQAFEVPPQPQAPVQVVVEKKKELRVVTLDSTSPSSPVASTKN